MKDTMGVMLREAWKEQGKSDCPHSEVRREYSFAGTVTGWSLCTTCGHRMSMEQVPEEVPHRTHILAPLERARTEWSRSAAEHMILRKGSL